jgi:hypothetical protein
MKKSIWQKVYSFFGFWTYTDVVSLDKQGNYAEYKVIYWCCLPWFKFFRKFDLVRIYKHKYNVHEELSRVSSML